MRRLWIPLFLLVAAAFLFELWGPGGDTGRGGRRGLRGGGEAPRVPVEVVRRTMERSVEAVGVVQPAFVLQVKSKASGQVTSTPFLEGDRVREGDLLVRLNPIDEERNLRKQRAQVLSARASLERARLELEKARQGIEFRRKDLEYQVRRARAEFEAAEADLVRVRHLHERQLAAEKALEDARNRRAAADAQHELARNQLDALVLDELDIGLGKQDIALAEAALEREQINLEVAEIRLAETEIRAPMDGLILERAAEIGEIIASGISNVSGGTSLMTLADVSRLFLEAEVDESDIGRIEVGMDVSLLAEAFPEDEFRGRVDWIAPRGESIESVTIFRVRIELLDEATRALLPGMNATARIIHQRAEGALVVPVEAIRRRGDRFGVEVPDEGEEPRFVEVEVGLRDGRLAEVRGELGEGDPVLVPADAVPEGGEDPSRTMRRGLFMMRRATRR